MAPVTLTVEMNLDLAAVLGWVPDDFGAVTHDEDLARKIGEWQDAHFLPRTCLGDAATYRALLAIRRAREECEADFRDLEALSGLGSVARLAPDDPKVLASAPFMGTVGTSADPLAAPWRVATVQATLTSPWEDGRAAMAALGRPGGVDGVAVLWPANATDRIKLGPPTLLRDFADAMRPAAALVPLAVGGDFDPTTLSSQQKAGLRHLGDVFSAAIPFAPGQRVHHAEFDLGTAVARWAFYTRITARFQSPALVAGDVPAEYVTRFRVWARDRGMRGCTLLASSPTPEVASAWRAPLPETIVRIDRKTRHAPDPEPQRLPAQADRPPGDGRDHRGRQADRQADRDPFPRPAKRE